MSSGNLVQILDKAQSKDRDFRYMATSDLLRVLQTDVFKPDADVEAKVCNIVLQQLEDTSGDISSLAVKCLGLLVTKVSDDRLADMLSKLCDGVLSSKKEQQRDTAAIGLKAVIAELPTSSPSSAGAAQQLLVQRAAPRLITGLATASQSKDRDSLDIVNCCLDLVTDMTAKFGGLMAPAEHARLRGAVLPELQEGRPGLRKRAMHCLAALASHLDDSQLKELVEGLLTQLQAPGTKPDLAKTYLQAIAAISRSVGFRFGKFLDSAVPAAVSHCRGAGEDEEMREVCLQALESFVARSPYEARPHALTQVVPLALQCLGHDPNYADDGDMEGDEDMDGGGDEYEDLSDDEGYSDDEDTSWKVRRAAAKALSAVIGSYPDLLPELYAQAAGRLVERFREREESVKADVFATFVDLLRAVQAAAKRYEGESDSMDGGPIGVLREDVPRIMAAAARQLREKGHKTRTGVLAMLTELVAVAPDSIAGHVPQLVPGIQANLNDKTSSASGMKITTLSFLRLAMASNDPSVFAPCVADIAPAVYACAGERYYKVTAEALRVCEQLCVLLRPDTSRPMDAKAKDLAGGMFGCVLPRLVAPDLDQEVKEAAMACAGTAVACMADVMPQESQQVIKTLLDRLRNEITRLAAVRAFAAIAQSPLRPDLGPALEPTLSELTSFLRKSNRQIKQTSLKALEALVVAYGSSSPRSSLDNALAESSTQVSDGDLMLAGQSLQLACAILRQQPDTAAAANEKVLPAAMQLVTSPLVQGHVLAELQDLFLALATAPGGDPGKLIDALLRAGEDPGTARTAQHSVAQCVAALAVNAAGGRALGTTVPRLLQKVQPGRQESEDAQRCALLCLGEIGARADLAPYSPGLDAAVLGCLQSPSEEVAAAASAAMGGVAIGNLQRFVPSLLDQIKRAARDAPKQQYLLLKSLNEVVTSLARRGGGAGPAAASSATAAVPRLSDQQRDDVLALLFAEPEGEEEECRNVAAQCMGHLALVCPSRVVPAMAARVGSPSAAMRQVVVTAAKYMVLEQPHEADEALRALLADCLKLIADEDRHVRRAALQALSGAAHNKPGLVADQLLGLLPLVYSQTTVDESLIRQVDLGPFKHKIDDGLELRKAAFEACDVLLDKCEGRVQLEQYIAALESGLKDHYDVKMPCHLMLSKLAGVAPGPLLAALPRLTGPLEQTLAAKLKSDAVKQEVDRNEDMLRSCLRAVDAINRMPDVDRCPAWRGFMANVVLGQGAMKDRFAAIQEERVEAEGRDPDA